MHLVATIIILLAMGFVVTLKHSWTYDFLEMENINLTPDVLNCQIQKIKVSRGVYAIGGYLEINQDLTDDLLLKLEIFYSQSGTGTYTKTPFQSMENTASQFFNTVYKNYLMDTYAECAENAPYFVDKIEMPITKRKIIFNDCVIPQENMPTYLRPGYYKILFTYRKQANGTITILCFVQPNN